MFSSLIVLALASQALATVRITAPFATTTCTGGQKCSITWNDDGTPPTLANFGAAHVGLFVGGTVQQAEVQPIADNVPVGTTAQIDFTVNPGLGPNGNFYFIRFISTTAKDPNFPTQPLSSFSAKFTLSGMSGTFNSTVQGVVDNANSAAPAAPGAPTPPAGAPPAGSSPAPAASTPAAGTTPAASRPASSPAASAATPAKSGTPTASAGAKQTGAATRASTTGAYVLSAIGAIVAVAF